MRTILPVLVALASACNATPKSVFDVYIEEAAPQILPDRNGWEAQPFSNMLGPGAVFRTHPTGVKSPFASLEEVLETRLAGDVYEAELKARGFSEASELREAMGFADLLSGEIEKGVTIDSSYVSDSGFDFGLGFDPLGTQRNGEVAATLSFVLGSATSMTVQIEKAAVYELDQLDYYKFVSYTRFGGELNTLFRGRTTQLCTRAVAARDLTIIFKLSREFSAEIESVVERGISGDQRGLNAGLSFHFTDDRTLVVSTAPGQVVFIDCFFEPVQLMNDMAYGVRTRGRGDEIIFAPGSGLAAKESIEGWLFGMILDSSKGGEPLIAFRELRPRDVRQYNVSEDEALFFNSNLGDLSSLLADSVAVSISDLPGITSVSSIDANWRRIENAMVLGIEERWPEEGFSDQQIALAEAVIGKVFAELKPPIVHLSPY